MAVVKGSKVKIAYVGKLKDGTVFDKSEESKPLGFTVGEGKVIKGVDDAVEGMNVGEKKTVNIVPADAYGDKDQSLIRRFPRSMLPAGEVPPEKGMLLSLGLPSGETVPATITELTDKDVFVDLNHPLAGQELTFDITVVAIE
jgi:peptidylprolyl isomerase